MFRSTGRATIALFFLSVIASILFLAKSQESHRYVRLVTDDAFRANPHCTTRTDSVLALTHEIYHRTNHVIVRSDMSLYDQLEAISPFNLSAGVSLKYGGFAIEGHRVKGRCGTMSTALLNCLWDLNIPARKLQINSDSGGHTLVEYLENGRWVVISPADSGFQWHMADGRPATSEEIRNDTNLFAQIYGKDPGATYSFKHCYHFRWTKVPKIIVSGLEHFMGKHWLENVQTPFFLDDCRSLFLWSTAIVSVLFAISLVVSFRREIKLLGWRGFDMGFTMRRLFLPLGFGVSKDRPVVSLGKYLVAAGSTNQNST